MAETELTKEIKKALLYYAKADQAGVYGCYEVCLGAGYGDEYVDFMTMNSKNEFKSYEIIDISKPIYAKIYDYDEAYCESDCDDTCGSYIIREVEELHFTTKRCEAFIRYSDGFVSKTFKLLPQTKIEGVPK